MTIIEARGHAATKLPSQQNNVELLYSLNWINFSCVES